MRKKFLLAVAFVLIVVPCALAQETPTLTKLTDNIYAYIDIKNASPAANSFGANCGVIIGSESVMVIDTLVSAKHARKLIDEIKKITDKPIKYVVNTHHHLDHSWGNSEFAKMGTIIIGQENIPFTAEQVEQGIEQAQMFGLTPEDLAGTTAKIPDILIATAIEVDLGDIKVAIQFPGSAHTIDNVTVLVKEDNVLFVGDIIFNKYHPYMGDGNIPGWIAVLKEIKKSKASIIVPGHGPVVSKKDVKEMVSYLRKFDRAAKKLSKNKTQADIEEIAKKLKTLLPDQKREELPSLIEMNLQTKYLPQPEGE